MSNIYINELLKSHHVTDLMTRINDLEDITINDWKEGVTIKLSGGIIYVLFPRKDATVLDSAGNIADGRISSFSIHNGKTINREAVAILHDTHNANTVGGAQNEVFDMVISDTTVWVFINPSFSNNPLKENAPILQSYDLITGLQTGERIVIIPVPNPIAGEGSDIATNSITFFIKGDFLYFGGRGQFLNKVPKDLSITAEPVEGSHHRSMLEHYYVLGNEAGSNTLFFGHGGHIATVADPSPTSFLGAFNTEPHPSTAGRKIKSYEVFNSDSQVVIRQPFVTGDFPGNTADFIFFKAKDLEPPESGIPEKFRSYPILSGLDAENSIQGTLQADLTISTGLYDIGTTGGSLVAELEDLPGTSDPAEFSTVFKFPLDDRIALFKATSATTPGQAGLEPLEFRSIVLYDDTGNFVSYFPPVDVDILTEWFKYPTSTTFSSIGFRPDDDDLVGLDSLVTSQLIIDMRDAITALVPTFINGATGNAFDTINGSPDNLYNIAMGTRSVYGDTRGIEFYDYAHDENTMNTQQPFDLDIGEILEQIIVLEASSST